MNKKNRTLVLTAIFTALAIVFNIVENIFIPPIQFGIRFGIANIVSIVVIKKVGTKQMFAVSFLRVILTALIRGSLFSASFFIGGFGVFLSSLIIYITHKSKSSIIFISIISAIFHSLGQVLVVIKIYSTVSIASLFPVIAFGSIATGVLTGIISDLILKRIKI